MPPRRVEWIERIKFVEREFSAVRLGVARLITDSRSDPTVLSASSLRPRDLEYAADRCEGTYLIRLFAEFETGLRLFWTSARAGEPPGRTRDLIDGISASRRIRDLDRDRVHEVREFRNALIHERLEDVQAISLPNARQHLCRFFSHLPLKW